MSTHQEHFGRKFFCDKKTNYWMSTTSPRIRAHQWVWINHHGNPPKGYHIHHRNNDKSDNRIENLELIHGARHLSYHMVHHMSDPIKKNKQKEHIEKIRPLTKAWHASDEGKAWHRYHALKNNFGNWEPKEYDCQQCGTKYFSKQISKKHTKFCSNKCKSKWRRHSKIDDVEKQCVYCKKIFTCNKYSKYIGCGCGRGRKRKSANK